MGLNERLNVSMIVAMDLNGAIGKNNDIPWASKLRADMIHFQNYTMGKTVVMGRKTYDSIDPKYKPLRGRDNIVLTKQPDFIAPGCKVVKDYKEIQLTETTKEVCVIGGAEIYNLFLPIAREVIITHVDTLIPDADTFFKFDSRDWSSLLLHKHESDEKNKFRFSIVKYTKIRED